MSRRSGRSRVFGGARERRRASAAAAPDPDVDRDEIGDDQLEQRVADCIFRFLFLCCSWRWLERARKRNEEQKRACRGRKLSSSFFFVRVTRAGR